LWRCNINELGRAAATTSFISVNQVHWSCQLIQIINSGTVHHSSLMKQV
jgi:hypothetical protein